MSFDKKMAIGAIAGGIVVAVLIVVLASKTRIDALYERVFDD